MVLKPAVNKRGHLTKNELAAVAYWKAPRSSGHAQKNSEDYVSEITGFALRTNSERARFESLTILDGVSWPTASVILHLFHRDPYPILDYRALWSVSLKYPANTPLASGGPMLNSAAALQPVRGWTCGHWIRHCGSIPRKTNESQNRRLDRIRSWAIQEDQKCL